MATSTFDKSIYIDDKAADKLIKILEQKPLLKPKNKDILKTSEETLKSLLKGGVRYE